jgi:muramoyltetrapeptide carboxypeptidase LdcA involved in peptidoglycan recycling
MNKAQRLSLGDTVALVNPAGMPPVRFMRYIPLMEKYLCEEGFVVKKYLAENTSNPEQLASMFMGAWTDPVVQAVFPICGNPIIFEVLKYLKAKRMEQKPIIFCGSSVLSALSVWLFQNARIVTFFGPHLPFIHTYAPQRENEFSVQSFWSMVMWKKGRTKRISSTHELQHFFSVRDQSHVPVKLSNIYRRSDLIKDERRRDATFISPTQEIVRGNTFCITLGALLEMKRLGMLLDISGSIVFTETMDWDLERVKGAFMELSNSTVFHGVNAVFITALTERTDRQEKQFPELQDSEKIEALCQSISSIIQMPIFYGFPLGHGSYKMTMPQGIPCTIDPDDGSVSLQECPVI